MDKLFHIIDGAQIILRSGGVFYQRKVFKRATRLYAQHGTGFVRIGAHDATSAPTISWEDLDLPEDVNVRIDGLLGPVLGGVK